MNWYDAGTEEEMLRRYQTMTRATAIAEANELGNRLSKLLREIGATEMVVTQKGWNRTYKVIGRPMGTTGYEGEVA